MVVRQSGQVIVYLLTHPIELVPKLSHGSQCQTAIQEAHIDVSEEIGDANFLR